jgi:hypothetical protein
VLVEPGAGIVAADRDVSVDLAVVFNQLRVQAAAGIDVCRSELTHVHEGHPVIEVRHGRRTQVQVPRLVRTSTLTCRRSGRKRTRTSDLTRVKRAL